MDIIYVYYIVLYLLYFLCIFTTKMYILLSLEKKSRDGRGMVFLKDFFVKTGFCVLYQYNYTLKGYLRENKT